MNPRVCGELKKLSVGVVLGEGADFDYIHPQVFKGPAVRAAQLDLFSRRESPGVGGPVGARVGAVAGSLFRRVAHLAFLRNRTNTGLLMASGPRALRMRWMIWWGE